MLMVLVVKVKIYNLMINQKKRNNNNLRINNYMTTLYYFILVIKSTLLSLNEYNNIL